MKLNNGIGDLWLYAKWKSWNFYDKVKVLRDITFYSVVNIRTSTMFYRKGDRRKCKKRNKTKSLQTNNLSNCKIKR